MSNTSDLGTPKGTFQSRTAGLEMTFGRQEMDSPVEVGTVPISPPLLTKAQFAWTQILVE